MEISALNVDKLNIDDSLKVYWKIIPGESILKKIINVELIEKNIKIHKELDNYSKNKLGYNDIGKLCLTNLRIVWKKNKSEYRYSIGYDNIQVIKYLELKDNTFVVSIINKSLHQYVFKAYYCKVDIKIIDYYYNLYLKTFYYRNLIKKSDFNNHVIPEKFKNEKIFFNINNISSYTSKKQLEGKLSLTNYRILWKGNNNESKVSIPLYQILFIKKKVIKNENILVVEVNKYLNSSKLAFKTNDNNINIIIEEIENKKSWALDDIYFGFNKKDLKESKVNDNYLIKKNDLIEEKVVFKQIYNESQNQIISQSNINSNLDNLEFNKEIGLCMVKLPENIKINDLWNIIND